MLCIHNNMSKALYLYVSLHLSSFWFCFWELTWYSRGAAQKRTERTNLCFCRFLSYNVMHQRTRRWLIMCHQIHTSHHNTSSHTKIRCSMPCHATHSSNWKRATPSHLNFFRVQNGFVQMYRCCHLFYASSLVPAKIMTVHQRIFCSLFADIYVYIYVKHKYSWWKMTTPGVTLASLKSSQKHHIIK